MEKITTGEIAAAVGGKLRGSEEIIIERITTDSRNCATGDLFIGIEGERFNGNDFAESCLDCAAAVLTDRSISPPEGKCVIEVSDTKKALRDLAAYYRGKFTLTVVGVTGSVGKTSTKDMIASVLSQGFKTLKTQGNFNNEIGLPLTVFNLSSEHEAAVLEMGMNSFGEISRLTAIARPSIAVITNIGTAHIGKLKTQQNILKAKLEILEKLAPGGLVVLNGDDKILYSLKGKLPHSVIYYGIDNHMADVIASDIVLGNDKSRFKVEVGGESHSFVINEVGQHHIYNALAAIIIGLYLKMHTKDIEKGVAEFKTGNMRQSITRTGGITIIDDCYNASPSSMKAALKVLSQLGGANRTIAVLGDILEQGSYSEKAHREVGAAVAEFEIKRLITVGEDAKFIAKEAEKRGMTDSVSFSSNAEAAKYLAGEVKKGDTVLFKASRGMHFEEISDYLKKSLGE
ncbi:MAG: UDP-N-acetylmuramoyl-tripeptide--D-alanyl-D-alanine ligase [Firmicutes bacterium ADurb.Bin193]|nr:MAG: UDP-N-acetylmuramoyl-tripeptide--D-alanyl-D-alanine ligase [Firmicutes bacterium ADurb.Bin193]